MAKSRNYTNFYHDSILAGFRQAIAEDLPEFTETDEHDPLLQLARLIAFEGHRWSSLLDFLAQEMFHPTARRRSSWIALARLVGFDLAADSPSTVDVLLNVSGTPGPADVLVPTGGIFTTARDAENDAVPFEYLGAGVVTGALTLEMIVATGGGVTFTAASTSTIAIPGPYGVVNDAVYFGHTSLLFSLVDLTYTGTPDQYTVIQEYFDGGFHQVEPFAGAGNVVDNGDGTLTINVESLLSTAAIGSELWTGASVTVESKISGDAETVVVAFTGGVHVITTVTYLGQAAPSTTSADYLISSDWLPLDTTTAANSRLIHATTSSPIQITGDGNHNQGAAHSWQSSTVNGVAAFWWRKRIVALGGVPVFPTNAATVFNTDNVLAVLVATIQGRSVVDVLGTTSGNADDEHQLNQEPFVGGSLTFLDVAGDTDWLPVASLFESDANDQHFVIIEQTDGSRVVRFGDGVNGQIPANGQVITASYRVDADDNGNVGIGTVDNASAGVQFVTNVRNPRAAAGWRQRDGADEAGIERLRRDVPGSLRARNRAVTPEDAEFLAVNTFETADGRKPFIRAVAQEQGAGFKTIRLILVGAGGTVPTVADATELETFFNGVSTGFQRFGGQALANQRIFALPFSPLVLNLAVTVDVVKRYAGTARGVIDAAIRAAIRADAAGADGTFRWWPQTEVTAAAITAIIGSADVPGLVDVAITAPALPIVLASDELPSLGTLAITIVEV